MTGPVHQTVVYRVDPGAVPFVEAAMAEYADYLAKEIPGSLWWTAKEQEDPTKYVTVIGAVDQATDDEIRTCEGTKRFVDILYANTIEDPVFTRLAEVATTAALVTAE